MLSVRIPPDISSSGTVSTAWRFRYFPPPNDSRWMIKGFGGGMNLLCEIHNRLVRVFPNLVLRRISSDDPGTVPFGFPVASGRYPALSPTERFGFVRTGRDSGVGLPRINWETETGLGLNGTLKSGVRLPPGSLFSNFFERIFQKNG